MPLPALALLAGRIGVGAAARAAGTKRAVSATVSATGGAGLSPSLLAKLAPKAGTMAKGIRSVDMVKAAMVSPEQKKDGQTADSDAAKSTEVSLQQQQAGQAAGFEMGKVSKKLAMVGGAAGLLALALAKMNKGVVDQAEQLAIWNASIASSTQILKAERFQRKMQLGAMVSGGAKRAAEAQSRLEAAALPAQAAMYNMKSYFTSLAATAVSNLLDGMNEMPIIGDILKWLADQEAPEEQAAILGFMAEMAGIRVAEEGAKAAVREVAKAAPPEGAEEGGGSARALWRGLSIAAGVPGPAVIAGVGAAAGAALGGNITR